MRTGSSHEIRLLDCTGGGGGESERERERERERGREIPDSYNSRAKSDKYTLRWAGL